MRTLLDRMGRVTGAVLLAATLSAHAADAPQPGVIEAVWKPQRVEFNYRSEGRLYPCELLERKVLMILQRLGAGDSLRLHGRGCHDLGQTARFEVVMESPFEATMQTVRDIATYDTRDELLARMHGRQLPSAADLPRFDATWEQISFRHGARLDLDAGDCALVQQLRSQVMTRMSVHITADIKHVNCSQEMGGFARPRLTVLALVPARPEPTH